MYDRCKLLPSSFAQAGQRLEAIVKEQAARLKAQETSFRTPEKSPPAAWPPLPLSARVLAASAHASARGGALLCWWWWQHKRQGSENVATTGTRCEITRENPTPLSVVQT